MTPPRWLMLAMLLGASAPAWASYRDGFFGLAMLYFGVPSALLALFIGGFMRTVGLFKYRRWQRVFQTLVGVPAGLVMVWVLFSNDLPSTAMVWIGYPLLAALATAPSWWRLRTPAIAPAGLAGHRWLALYWLASGLWPLLQSAPVLMRAQLPADALLWALLLPALIFGAPRWLGAAALLRQRHSAQAWLVLALLIAMLGLAKTFAAGAPEAVLAMALSLLALDLLVWALGLRLQARRA